MTGPVVDVDAVAIAIAELQASAAVLAEFGAGAVSGLNEPPYPHLRVAASPGGDDGRLLWTTTGEVTVQCWGAPDGQPGRAELRRLLYVALNHLARVPDRAHTPGRPVVVDAYTVGSARWAPDAASGQPCWAHTMRIVAHPDNTP